MIGFLLVMGATFLAMEGVSYLVHRFVYHGLLWAVHRSHHARRKGVVELNDLFPVAFAVITIGLFVLGTSGPGYADAVPAAAGMTLYGAVYFFIHDLYIHRRARWMALRLPFLLPLKKAHAYHHKHGGEPYGLLLFTSPSRVTALDVHDDEQV